MRAGVVILSSLVILALFFSTVTVTQTNVDDNPFEDTPETRPYVSNVPPVADAGIDQTVNEGNTVYFDGTNSYDPDGGLGGAWTLFSNAPMNMSRGASVALGGDLYYIGGTMEFPWSAPSSRVIRYTPATDTWTTVADLPESRMYLGAAVTDGKIYAFGGTADGRTIENTTFEYDPTTDTWTEKGLIPLPLLGFATGVVNDRVYVIGGLSNYTRYTIRATVFEYDPATDSWARMTDMPTPRMYLTAATVGGKIIVIGGYAPYYTTNTVEAYDPMTDSWTVKASMPTAREGLRAEVVGGMVFAIGGWTKSKVTDKTEIYDPVTNGWITGPSMLSDRGYPGSGTVGNCIYVLGGDLGTQPGWPTFTEVFCFNEGLLFEWDFDSSYDSDGDGDPVNDIDATGQIAVHLFKDDGTFVVTLKVTDSGNLSDTDTCLVTVLNVSPTVDLEVFTSRVNVSLRMAGEKWHDVAMMLYESDTLLASGSLTRYPGSPNVQMLRLASLVPDLTKNYSAIVIYTPDDDPVNGQPNGANPCWIILGWEDGNETRLHHTFNVKHPESYIWEVNLTDEMFSRSLMFEGHAYDPGADDLTFIWDFGDGTKVTNHHPNPGGSLPVIISEVITHEFSSSGALTITLRVIDDDGGQGVALITLVIP